MNKILIANRGEIALRVIQTARAQGFRTVAVYSEADADALHVQQADQAVCIGPASVSESYLVVDEILEAAKLTGADAIHPGYGFLSENADFAKACQQAGITFIGPNSEAIELMGSKRLSKIAMIEAGVPCIPGYQDAEQSDEVLIAKANEIGFPLMIKASAGGGGRGMRLVFKAEDVAEQLKTARSEAQNAFGSGELILERAVLQPRHIEIQVFADTHGNAVYLGERDCSIQRRHQKVVEEAPSPFVAEELREKMGQAAVNAALACNYVGAGTVEFLVDSEHNFYFLEMNTRLQVEHPVTELITGQDLVAWQLAVAAGEPLPLTQDEINYQGHAIEVRLYAEDPRENFMPQTGKVALWETPKQWLSDNVSGDNPLREGIRIDHCIAEKLDVSPHYDPMLAKVISYAPTRVQAARKLASALQDLKFLGLNNNKHFLQNILRHPVFLDGEATTAFIEEHFSEDVSITQTTPDALTQALASILLYQSQKKQVQSWRASAANSYQFKLQVAGEKYQTNLSNQAATQNYTIAVGDELVAIEVLSIDANQCVYIYQGVRQSCVFANTAKGLFIDAGNGHFTVEDITQQPAEAGGSASGQIKAAMDGAIVDVLVAAGDKVTAGQTLVVQEAMKMEHQLKAPMDGVVESVSVSQGMQVKTRQLLVQINAEE